MACNTTTLQSDACDNGFYQLAQNEVMYRAVVLQMLCNGLILPNQILGEFDATVPAAGNRYIISYHVMP